MSGKYEGLQGLMKKLSELRDGSVSIDPRLSFLVCALHVLRWVCRLWLLQTSLCLFSTNSLDLTRTAQVDLLVLAWASLCGPQLREVQRSFPISLSEVLMATEETDERWT